MADDALFIGWGQVVRGREPQALTVFQEAVEYFGTLQQDGRIESFDAYLLAPHGGDLDGFMILRGERKALGDVRFSDGFERIIARANAIIDSLGVTPAFTGEALALRLALGQEAAQELGT